ncbi:MULTISPECIES: cation diffusion facilitator family transporter [unclassified Coleofasciculus]|uniref:cation diffusion facilitator family transporter n=1 Tax=unclassified Coleofasciculus TaxID=2692782 RepID=UPI00187FFED0|nr:MULTISPECIES: cation diffusion facilitator family transporter [unclassified Coleofasciculus]MBE9125945.1 cation diffusion facilitator family transporter [Coleofasciculus sp. LEGE 07081]MBE9149317.1 cation diffusion facilitator family transporter [Coleofasciculus sp. LEGE 07092]
MTEGQNRDQAGRLILFTTLWLTLFVLSVKVSAAWATRSLSLMAESLHTLIVSFSMLLSLVKLTAHDRPMARSVYGHGKRETFITFLLIAFLGFVGLNLWIMSSQQLTTATQGEPLPFPIRVSLPLIQLLGVVVATSLGLALLSLYKGKVLGNSALRFNSRQLLKDVWLTLLVLGGLLGVWWGLVWLDVVLAILLVLLAAGSCWQVISWQLPLLVQQTAIAPEVLAQIAHQVGGVTHCYKIQSRGIIGRLVYIQMHLVIHPEFAGVTTLIVERIKGMLQERYGSVQVTFYIDDDFREAVNWHRSTLKSEANGKSDHLDD